MLERVAIGQPVLGRWVREIQKPGAPVNFEANIEQLHRWATGHGLRVQLGAPLDVDTIDIFPQLITPFFGEFSFRVPPSYRRFLELTSSLQVQANYGTVQSPDWCQVTGLDQIYSPDAIIDARGFVLIPQGVSDGAGTLTTNHLLAFAGDVRESHWCFVTDHPDQTGECPILRHSNDALAASRVVETGRFLSPQHVSIAHHHFLDWFHSWVATIVAIDEGIEDLL